MFFFTPFPSYRILCRIYIYFLRLFFYTNVAWNLLCMIDALSVRQMVQHINSLAICHSLLTNRMCCDSKKKKKKKKPVSLRECYENTSAIRLHLTSPQTTVPWLIAGAWISENILLMFPETLSSSHVLIRYCTPDVMRCSVAYRPTIN